MKIGVFHDNLLVRGGAERTMLKVSEMFDADLFTSGLLPSKFTGWNISRVKDIGNTTARVNISFGNAYTGFHSFYRAGYLETALRFYLRRKSFDYDVNIFSGSYCIMAAKKERFNILYCHSPNRTLYDQWERVYYSKPWVVRPIWDAYSFLLKPSDQRIVKECMDLVIANSENVRKRIKKYYGIDSEVLFEPVTTNNFKFKSFGDFYLSVNRLDVNKRVDVMVEAFCKMPDKKLVVAGDGPLMPKLKELAKGCDNIVFLGRLDDEVLSNLYGNCFATIFLPIQEDFGMGPIEGNAAGKPCISVDEGGCKETVLPGKTGFFIEPTIDALVDKVNELDFEVVSKMKDDCIEWSKNFDDKIYHERMMEYIREYID